MINSSTGVHAFGLALLVAVATVSAGRSGDPLSLDTGKIAGVISNDPTVRVYKGIPYAAPPLGEWRWRAPRPATPWVGVRAADAFGHRCMGRNFGPAAPSDMSEDCLFLNVWTPADARNERLPVFVWIHGGGFQGGSGSEAVFNGDSLARQRLVVVTFNYRVGVLGFFAHSELTRESEHRASGNYGLLDQVAALEWVKRNIQAFGGDPRNVTIAGESAGAYSVSALTASPLARGLFHRAIAESGAYLSPKGQALRSLAAAEKIGAEFARSLRAGVPSGSDAPDVAALRAMSSETLLRAVAKMEDFFAFQPIVDGRFLTEPVYTTYREGRQAKVPLLIGSNTDEGAFLLADRRPSVEEFDAQLGSRFGAFTSRVRELYPTKTAAALIRSELDLAGDVSFTYPMWKWAVMQREDRLPVYLYLFGRTLPATSGQTYKGIPREAIGALHGDEVPYVFGTLNDGASLDGSVRKDRWEQADRDLSAAMVRYWANFVKRGDPNGPGLAVWPQYLAAGRDPLMHFEHEPAVRPDARTARMTLLDAILTSVSTEERR